MKTVWVVYRLRGELYSMWCERDRLPLFELLYVSEFASDEWWEKVKNSRRHDTIEGRVRGD